MTPREIGHVYRELRRRLNALAVQEDAQQNGEWGAPQWNREIKGVLVQLAAAHGYQTCATQTQLPDGIESDWGEWLYDVVWLRTDSDPLWDARWTLRKVGLVAEIEWHGRDDAWEDYQKLHVAKADVRVMVYYHHPGLLEDCISQLALIGPQVSPEDCYIFAVYQPGEGRFAFAIRGN